MHPHVCGGGRVSDGVVSPFAKKKKTKCVRVHILVELGFEIGRAFFTKKRNDKKSVTFFVELGF